MVPFLDDELAASTEVLEDLLLALSSLEDDPDLPAALGRPAAEATGNLRLLLSKANFTSLYAPDGRYEHEPMAIVTAEAGMIEAVGAAVTELARISAGAAPDVVVDVAEEFTHGWQRPTTVASVVELAARFHGVCDLEWSDDHEILAGAMAIGSDGSKVTLSTEQEAAYRRVRDRFVAMWHDFSSLARWQY